MYSVEISNHVMVAHSLKGEVFGPASQLHGLTAHVHVAIFAEELDENGIVIDIGNALEVLARSCSLSITRTLMICLSSRAITPPSIFFAATFTSACVMLLICISWAASRVN